MAKKASIDYNKAVNACNPETDVTLDQLDTAIEEIRNAIFAEMSHEDISISHEASECEIHSSPFPPSSATNQTSVPLDERSPQDNPVSLELEKPGARHPAALTPHP